jgi:hypothetical protein
MNDELELELELEVIDLGDAKVETREVGEPERIDNPALDKGYF